MIVRQRLRVTGVVQGVGFRPFVWRLAHRLGISGEVCNVDGAVLIDAQGEASALQALQDALAHQAPPLARVAGVALECAEPIGTPAPQPAAFRIAPSRDGGVNDERDASGAGRHAARDDGALPVDSALCEACLRELFDPGDRRYRYGLIGCCDCGPRYTVTRRLPYDRAHTSMAPFALCAACAAEYADPANRRFHAELIACPHCGPQLRHEPLMGPAQAAADGLCDDPVASAWQALARGQIVAVQGLGGFQLMCDAANPRAVARLRERKRRPAKPLALLALNAACAARWAAVDDGARALLVSPARPVVVMPRRAAGALAGIAPGLDRIGLMLPCTPVQYLLFHQALGRPRGTGWLDDDTAPLLVATSANVSGDPVETDPEHARRALAGIADALVFHHRAIVARCDDSVALAAGGTRAPLPLRRARGYAPQPLALPGNGPSVLALGAHQKSTVTLTLDARAFVSPYIGDLGSPNACEALQASVQHLIDLRRARPDAIACDQQPDLYSTRLAHTLAAHWGVPLIAVQHHHAHIAAVLAEHGHAGPALGLALDGFGWGDEDGGGGAWGGELLHLEAGQARRLGHLTPLPLPGGDMAARQPARMALALLHRLDPRAGRCPPGLEEDAAARLHGQIARGFNCPPTTSLGRWFDAIAGLAGFADFAGSGGAQTYSGQAAMWLQALARPAAARTNGWRIDGLNLDLLPLAGHLATLRDPVQIASLWHATLAAALADWLRRAMAATGLNVIALGGGCCANLTLMHGVCDHLHTTPLQSRHLPPGDDAISYGQAWIAARQLRG